jgi:hypothetical protein
MPLKQDGRFHGTEANGTVSKKYCSFCFQHGKFTFSEISVTEMKALVNKNKNYPKVFKWYYTSRLGKLERWGQPKETTLLWLN